MEQEKNPEELAAEKTGGQSAKETKKPRKKLRWSSLSYSARVMLAFALIAAMTVIVAMGVVSFVWEQHFQSYTRENIQTKADVASDRIAMRYKANRDTYDSSVLEPARNTAILNSGLGIQVVDAGGNVLYDSTTDFTISDDSSSGSVSAPSLAPTPSASGMASAEITVDDKVVGEVRVWAYGSDALMRPSDREFRDNSYQALIVAAVVAIALATLIGFLFARSLVRPVRRITDTAEALKEGNFKARTNMVGDDEISRLGQTFDAMASSIDQSYELERRLTTDVAHELRTPLMAIQSTVEAMVDGVFPADAEHLAVVNSEVQRLSRLVDSLLKLSRLENRSNAKKEELIDVGELISGIVITHEAYVEDAGLTLDYRADPDTYVMGDSDMIRQATANLISNAVRYTPEGGHISVRVGHGDAMASIAVQDTGIGLSPEEAKKVFQRFWRADAGRNRASGGLGIGLSVVKEIVDRHEGWVEVDGRKNEGACFTIYIPLYDRTSKQQKNPSKVKSLRREMQSRS
jgi:two-component system, OmpR family, sensor histidine kinase BaeS